MQSLQKNRRGNRGVLFQFGLLAGLVQVVTGVEMYLAGIYFARGSIFVSLFVLLLCIVAGVRGYGTRYLHGRLTYRQALLAGIAISVSTGVAYALYNIISISFFYPGFLDEVARLRLENLTANGQSSASFEAVRANVSAGKIAVSNLVGLSLSGTLLSLVSAWFLKQGTTSHVETEPSYQQP